MDPKRIFRQLLGKNVKHLTVEELIDVIEATVSETVKDELNRTLDRRKKIAQKKSARNVIKATYPVNKQLILSLFKSLSNYDAELSRLFEEYEQNGKFEIRQIRDAIADSFPSPIGSLFRKILTDNTVNQNRLQNIVSIYDATVQLLCYSSIAQLYKLKKSGWLKGIEEKDVKWLQSFFLLIRERYDVYDYKELLVVLIQIFEKKQIPFYISQIPSFTSKIQEGEDLYEAHKYFVKLKQALKNEMTDYKIGVSCEIAESYLAKLMEHLSFVTNYKLIFIRMIENNKVLNNKNDVILIRNEDKFGENLKLGPLLIDGNSLSGKRNTRFYFYMCTTKNEFYYHYIENKDDVIIVSQQNFPEMYNQMSDFLETLLPNFNNFDENN